MRAVASVLACLAPLLGAGPAAAGELWERPWLEVRTPHFVLLSALDAERSVELALDLESFRRAVELVTNIGRFEERIPTHVTVLPNRVSDLGFARAIGFFVPGMRANHAAVAPAAGAELAQTLRHEYVHFLVRNRDRLRYPRWYDEGFADLLATVSVRDGVLEYGKPLDERIAALQRFDWIGFEGLLATREVQRLPDLRIGMFYAQSWLLVHYLTLGRKGQNLAVENTAFLAALEAGASPQDAFAQAFGLEVRRLDRLLRRHLRRLPYYSLRLTKPLVEESARVEPLPPDAVAARLGALALSVGETARAERFFEAAARLDPGNTAALVGRATLHDLAGRFGEAEPLHRRALELEPGAALHELDFGAHYLARARAERDPELARRHLERARQHLARSRRLDPQNPETLAMEGASYLHGEDPAKALAALEEAHALLPSHPEILLLLAQAYVAAERPEAARPLLQAVVAWADESRAARASELLAGLGPAALR